MISPMPSSPQRILCLALSGIGNYLMQSPVFAAIKRRYPGSHLTVWVAPRGTRAFAEQNLHLDDIIESPIKLSPLGHLRLVHRLTRGSFDTGIVLSPGQLWKSAAYLYLAGIPQRIGNAYPFRGNRRSTFLLTDAIPEINGLHDIEQNLRLLDPLGIKEATVTNYDLAIAPTFEQQAQQLLNAMNISTDRKLVGFHMGSAPDFVWKRWPLENFITVARKMIEDFDSHILLFGDESERAQNEQVARALGAHVKVISSDLLTCAAVMKGCRIFLANDSGLMHVAAAVGTRTFGLFGPTDERHTGPRGKHSAIIRAPGTVAVYHTEKNYTVGQSVHPSMRAITPALVLHHIIPYLR